MTREERNAAAIATLHQEFRPLAEQCRLAWEGAGMKPCIVQARRTWIEQAALYAKGRTEPGPRVTDAKAGYGYHNYGLAFDFVDFAASGEKDRYEPEDFDHMDYQAARDLAQGLGLTWGGLWRVHPDQPHVEFHPGIGASSAITLALYAPSGFLPIDFFGQRCPDRKV